MMSCLFADAASATPADFHYVTTPLPRPPPPMLPLDTLRFSIDTPPLFAATVLIIFERQITVQHTVGE